MKRTLFGLLLSLFSLWGMAQDYSNLYVVGAAFDCGWTAEKAFSMEKGEDGVFTWSGNMKSGDFKFLLKTTPGDLWINCLNAKKENERIILGHKHELIYIENSRETGGDYKFMMSDEGVFNMKVDTKNMTLEITKSDLISVSRLDGKGKRIVNIHSSSGKASGDEHPYKLLIGREENLKDIKNKWAYNGDDPWVIFSMPAIYEIDKFGFRDGRIKETGSSVKNLSEYKVFVSTTGVEDEDWSEIIHETNVGELDEKLIKIDPVEARYIKFIPVKDPEDPYVRIYGVDIYGKYVRPINEEVISKGKSIVDYHNSWSVRETPANILDGNMVAASGEDANNPWAFGKGSTNGWVIIDLEDKYDITKFVLTDSEEWLTGYKVHISNFVGKESDWKLIAEKTFDKLVEKKEIELDAPVQGRYLKLEIPLANQEGLARIREFEVYGTLAVKPTISTNREDIKKAYELALWTVDYNTTQSGILNAGARYDGKWTRDLSINVWNGFAFLEPEIAKNSLLSLLENNSQQTIGAEYWDKIIWVKGAYMYYLTTGDTEFLSQILKSGLNTMDQLEKMKRDNNPVFDSEYGLFTGPSVFNDGIAGYETPIFAGNDKGGAVVSHPAHNKIKCLSTNCIYYEAYRLLAEIAKVLEEETYIPNLEEKATNLKANIRKYLFDEENIKLSYLVDQNGDVHPHQEGLGISFAILFDIVTEDEAEKIVDNAFITAYGLPSVSPHFKRFSDDKPGRHNVMIWPFVNAFFADACLKAGAYDKYKFELFNLADLAINKGENSFWEIYDPKDGRPDGGWQTGGHWGGLEHQTWSATGFLNMVWYGLAGIQLQEDKIVFTPYLPEEITNMELTGLKYGDMILNIALMGKGTQIKSFKINNQSSDNFEISRNLIGEQFVEIELEEAPSVAIESVNLNDDSIIAFPQDGSVVVQLYNDLKTDCAELYNITGTRIDLKNNVQGIFILGNDLPMGVYVLKIYTNGTSVSKRIIIT